MLSMLLLQSGFCCTLKRKDLLQSAFINKIVNEVINLNMLMFVDEQLAIKEHQQEQKGGY